MAKFKVGDKVITYMGQEAEVLKIRLPRQREIMGEILCYIKLKSNNTFWYAEKRLFFEEEWILQHLKRNSK